MIKYIKHITIFSLLLFSCTKEDPNGSTTYTEPGTQAQSSQFKVVYSQSGTLGNHLRQLSSTQALYLLIDDELVPAFGDLGTCCPNFGSTSFYSGEYNEPSYTFYTQEVDSLHLHFWPGSLGLPLTTDSMYYKFEIFREGILIDTYEDYDYWGKRPPTPLYTVDLIYPGI